MKSRHGVRFLLISVCLCLSGSFGQHFDPNVEDKAYLDQIENDIQAEVDLARDALRVQAKHTQNVARNFAGAKIKENLFTALRVLAEKEQESIRLAKKELENKQGKQEDEEEDEGGAQDPTTRRPNNIIPVVGNLVKAFFGGNSINLTSYVESASRFLPSPVGTQLLGVVKILAHNPSRLTTPPPPPATIIALINGTNGTQAVATLNGTQLPVALDILNATTTTTTTTVTVQGTTEESVGEEEEDVGGGAEEEETAKRKEKQGGRQLNLPSLTSSINFLGMLFGGSRTTQPPAQNVRRTASGAGGAPAAVAVNTTESAAGFEEERDTTQQFSLEGLANSVRNGLGDMIRIAPDIFKGAREAVNLISGLSSFIGDLDL